MRIIEIPDVEKPTNRSENANKNRVKEILLKWRRNGQKNTPFSRKFSFGNTQHQAIFNDLNLKKKNLGTQEENIRWKTSQAGLRLLRCQASCRNVRALREKFYEMNFPKMVFQPAKIPFTLKVNRPSHIWKNKGNSEPRAIFFGGGRQKTAGWQNPANNISRENSEKRTQAWRTHDTKDCWCLLFKCSVSAIHLWKL